MRTFTSQLLCVGAIVGLLGACDSSDTTPIAIDGGPSIDLDSGPGGGSPVVDGSTPDSSTPLATPTITIESPANNATVALSATKQITITFSTNYTLKPPGKCAGQPDCGHVWVLVDGTACDIAGKSYNTQALASPTSADLSKCATPTGKHVLTVELRHDDGTKVVGPSGSAILAQARITTQ